MDYFDILKIHAENMAKTLYVESGNNPAYINPRFIESLGLAYGIIAHDSRAFVIKEMLTQVRAMGETDENAMRIIGNFLVKFADEKKINLKQ